MGAHDFQMGVKDEVSYGTPLVVDRFFEYEGDPMPVAPVAGRTESDPMRVGTRARRANRMVPYTSHAEGHVDLPVMTKNLGWWLKHLLPSVTPTGSGPYVYTATEGTSSALMGRSFTAQFNAPFHPAGTNQAVTFSGGKVPQWSLSNSVDEMLILGADLWFNQFTTATALATASYPNETNNANLSWVGGVVTIAGSSFDITNISIEVNQNYDLDRAQIRGNSAKKEPTPGRLEVSWSIEADFDSLTQFNRVHSATVAGASASIVGTWTNGSYSLATTMTGARFDEFSFGGERGGLTQELSGVAEYDGTNSPINLVYTTPDATA